MPFPFTETVPLTVLEALLVAMVWDWLVKQQVNKASKRVKPKILCVEVLISFDRRVER